jgi:hypothetical protein
MSDSETGGDGSVAWNLLVDRVRKVGGVSQVTSQDNGQGHHQSGTDENGAPGEVMTVSVETPRGTNAADFLAYLRENGLQVAGNRVYLNIRIESNNADQVRISWGNSPNRQNEPPPFGPPQGQA